MLVKLEKTACVLGVFAEPVASLSDSKPFESPAASNKSESLMINPN